MRNVTALMLILWALSACAAAPQEEEILATSSGPKSETLLSRQAVAAQEQSARMEVRISEFEKQLGVLGQLVRRLTQRQSSLEARLERQGRRPKPAAATSRPRPVSRRYFSPKKRARRQPTPKAVFRAPRPPPAVLKRAKRPPRRRARKKLPRTSREAYNVAYRAIRARRGEEAILLFRNFLRRFPRNRLAANAQYWLGESYYDLKEFPASLEEFQKVIKRYPKSRKVPDAYYKRGLTYLRIRDHRRAALEFEKLIENFSRHHLTKKARKQLQSLHLAGRRKPR